MRDEASTSTSSYGSRLNRGAMEVLLVLLPDSELDQERSEQLLRQLRAEIGELDIDAMRSVPQAVVAERAKGSEAAVAGAIFIALCASGGVFTALIETLRDWLGRHSARHRISLTIDGDAIELERASAEERRQLVEAYICRHTDD